jgi:uncharacterized membrane protein YecN with MAPEG domain
MALQTTALYAIPLIVLCLVLWFRVTNLRAELKVSIGDAGNTTLHERVRQHGNFIEWTSLVLLLMVLAGRKQWCRQAVAARGRRLVGGRSVDSPLWPEGRQLGAPPAHRGQQPQPAGNGDPLGQPGHGHVSPLNPPLPCLLTV